MSKKELCIYQGKQAKEKMTNCKKKFVRYKEGAEIYSIVLTKFSRFEKQTSRIPQDKLQEVRISNSNNNKFRQKWMD